jgi:hypothetical protein
MAVRIRRELNGHVRCCSLFCVGTKRFDVLKNEKEREGKEHQHGIWIGEMKCRGLHDKAERSETALSFPPSFSRTLLDVTKWDAYRW